MKIIIFSNIPSPYFVEYLNELGKMADVTAYFERESASDRDSSWKKLKNRSFEASILGGINFGPENSLAISVLRVLSLRNDEIVVFANPMTPTGIIGTLYCQKKRIPYVLQSEGGFVKTGKGIKERIKTRIVKNASLCISGMKPHNDYFIGYGAKPENVYYYPFASLHSSDIPDKLCEQKEKRELKEELHLPNNKIVLYVGRMLHVKGVDVLVKASKSISKDANIVMVGGEPTPELRKIIEENSINNITFIKHVQLNDLKKYYCAADVFVLPTRSDTWGLVINEAMTYGLPVITTNKCVAGLELIQNDHNGYIVPSEDVNELAAKVNHLLINPELRHEMGRQNIIYSRQFTYENMSRHIYQALHENMTKLQMDRL